MTITITPELIESLQRVQAFGESCVHLQTPTGTITMQKGSYDSSVHGTGEGQDLLLDSPDGRAVLHFVYTSSGTILTGFWPEKVGNNLYGADRYPEDYMTMPAKQRKTLWTRLSLLLNVTVKYRKPSQTHKTTFRCSGKIDS